MIDTIFSCLQAVGVIASILFAARQIIKNRKILEHDSYERLSREYQEHLWQPMEFRHLDKVWEPLSDGDLERLNSGLTGSQLWGVWASMSDEEKDCYRYTRGALEIFERAWQSHDSDHIDDETWAKWTAWVRTWSKSSYFFFVYSEARIQLIDGFAGWIDSEIQPSANKRMENNG